MPVRWSQRASRKTPAVGRAIHVVGRRAASRPSRAGRRRPGRGRARAVRGTSARSGHPGRSLRCVVSTPSPRSRRRIASPKPSAADPADERDVVPEPGEPDRHVRLGAGDEALEGGRFGQRPRRGRHERDEALPERDDLGHRAGPPIGPPRPRRRPGRRAPGRRPDRRRRAASHPSRRRSRRPR